MIDDSQPSDPAPLIDPALLPFLDQAEFSLRDAEHHARSIYLAFSRIHPEEVTPQTIEAFHDLIERWYRSHRKWIGLCREQCREVEAISTLAAKSVKTVVDSSKTQARIGATMNDLGGNQHDQGTPGKTDGIGPVDCPYCGVRVSDSVRYLGQAILCPKCNGTFTAPETRENVLMMQLVAPVITGGLFILAVYYMIQSFLLAP